MDQRLRLQLMDLFQVVHIRLMEHNKEMLKRYNLPFTHLFILAQIEKEPGITVSGLARQSGLVKSYISTTIEELSLRGMVDKRPDKNDQRLTRIFLTDPALDLLKDIRGYMEEQFTNLLDEIPDAQIESMLAGLTVLHDVLKKGKSF
ncbi:MarR family transcriptional regulator [Pelotomaculum terephthalicicum JT]|uniref:MarR family winged helix-turn-helix transcriptional regulator n=1 Tax=Pelotomaculum TaxID=191373 RepID=UPI0009C4413F|nr:MULTISPECIES: MarR family transcriptional regulator [Pelotomaculum]MCG9968691.1 MarR family transcriptional regulator [Pelotomaculum terephthalicicum JT]OPX91707.1 MAG: transcriptional regulator SlyA [Pelotomaculum sp. PtaB.Bin117]